MFAILKATVYNYNTEAKTHKVNCLIIQVYIFLTTKTVNLSNCSCPNKFCTLLH
jgi:hypothetical protein